MKFLSTLSAALALTTGMAAAVPMNLTLESHMAMQTPPNITDVETLVRFVRINQKEFTGPLPLLISVIGGLLGPSLAGSLQNAVAELFKGGDLVLNGPLDAIEQLLKLNLPGALKSVLGTIVNTLKSLPKDATNIIGGGKKPEKKPQ